MKNKLILYMLLLVPIISSILSTVHIISLTSLGNPIVMAIATAITYEISSIVSFISSSVSYANVSKARLYFIFVVLFILQCVGNTYSGFHYINEQLASDSTYLNDIMEMSFSLLKPAELKLALSALIGIPLPLISLIMLKSALEIAENESKPIKNEEIIDENPNTIVNNESDNVEQNETDYKEEHVEDERPIITKVKEIIKQNNPIKKTDKQVQKTRINNNTGTIDDRDPSDENKL